MAGVRYRLISWMPTNHPHPPRPSFLLIKSLMMLGLTYNPSTHLATRLRQCFSPRKPILVPYGVGLMLYEFRWIERRPWVRMVTQNRVDNIK